MKNWQCALFSITAHAQILGMPVAEVIQAEKRPEDVRLIILNNQPISRPVNKPAADSTPQIPSHISPQTAQIPKPVKTIQRSGRSKPVHPQNTVSEIRQSDRLEPAILTEQKTLSESRLQSALVDPERSSVTPVSSRIEIRSAESANLNRTAPVSSGESVRKNSGSVETEVDSPEGPDFIIKTQPRYPRLARRLGQEGTGVLRLNLEAFGRLRDITVISGAGTGLDEEAIRAVQQSTFFPAVRAGRPVDSLALLTIRFQLASKE